MNLGPCKEIPVEALVDYADDELPDDERAQLCEHLEKCDACRARLEALERSLQLAKLIWQDAEARNPNAHVPSRPKSKVFASPWRLAIAASVLFAVVEFLERHFFHEQGRPSVSKPVQHATLEEIENHVMRAGLAAQLFATAEVLDKLEGGQAAAEKQYAYITERYSDTEQAGQARRRLEERSNP